MPGVDSYLLDNRIIIKDPEYPDWGQAALTLCPVDEIIHIEPVGSELPALVMVHPILSVGGAEQLALKIIDELQERISFSVVSFENLDDELGTTADSFRQLTPYVYTLPEFLDPSLFYSFMRYLIKRFKPKSLYIANGTPWIYDFLGEIKRRNPQIRIANQVYDSVIGWIHRYDLSLVTYIDAHIGANKKICQAYIDEGVKPEQAFLIEHGIDPSELSPSEYSPERVQALKKNFKLPGDKKIVTFASRIHHQKRPMDFVELARRLVGDNSIHFLMVGDGPLAAVIDNQINKIKLTNISRLPFYRPISDILALTDVLVLPSEFEGMPMIILEAQTMGIPVVVTDVGGNQDVIEITNGGVVTSKIGDVSRLMGGVRNMLENPPDGEEVRQKTLSHFDISIIAEKYYRALLPK